MVLPTVYFGAPYMHCLDDEVSIHVSGGESLTSAGALRSVPFDVLLLRQIFGTRGKGTWWNSSRTLEEGVPKMRSVEEEQNTTHYLMAATPPLRSCLGIDR
jgi:hypothetical protein